MTRETKLGLVVSCSFLCLLGVVLGLKLTEIPDPSVVAAAPTTPEEDDWDFWDLDEEETPAKPNKGSVWDGSGVASNGDRPIQPVSGQLNLQGVPAVRDATANSTEVQLALAADRARKEEEEEIERKRREAAVKSLPPLATNASTPGKPAIPLPPVEGASAPVTNPTPATTGGLPPIVKPETGKDPGATSDVPKGAAGQTVGDPAKSPLPALPTPTERPDTKGPGPSPLPALPPASGASTTGSPASGLPPASANGGAVAAPAIPALPSATGPGSVGGGTGVAPLPALPAASGGSENGRGETGSQGNASPATQEKPETTETPRKPNAVPPLPPVGGSSEPGKTALPPALPIGNGAGGGTTVDPATSANPARPGGASLPALPPVGGGREGIGGGNGADTPTTTGTGTDTPSPTPVGRAAPVPPVSAGPGNATGTTDVTPLPGAADRAVTATPLPSVGDSTPARVESPPERAPAVPALPTRATLSEPPLRPTPVAQDDRRGAAGAMEVPATVSRPTLVGDGPPRASVPPIAVASNGPAAQLLQPKVISFTERMHITVNGDTFDRLSVREYGSERFGQALLLFNRSHPLVDEVIPDGGALRPGRRLFLPPREVLESRYPSAIGGRPSTTETQRSNAAPTEKSRPVAAPKGRSYTVQGSGETMRQIAARELGSAEKWTEVFQLNPAWRPEYPVPPGTILTLPR